MLDHRPDSLEFQLAHVAEKAFQLMGSAVNGVRALFRQWSQNLFLDLIKRALTPLVTPLVAPQFNLWHPCNGLSAERRYSTGHVITQLVELLHTN